MDRLQVREACIVSCVSYGYRIVLVSQVASCVTAAMRLCASRNLIFELKEVLIMKDAGEEWAGVLEGVHKVRHNTPTVL